MKTTKPDDAKLPPVPDRPVSEADWRQWLKRDLYFAEERLKQFGEVRPMFVIHSRDGGIVIVLSGWADDAARQRVQAQVGMICLAHDAVALSFISEAWMRITTPRIGESAAEYYARIKAVAPRDADDRFEVVSATLCYVGSDGARHGMGAVRGIERNAEGRAVACTVMPGHDDRKMAKAEMRIDGITHLLPLIRTTPEQRRKMQELLDNLGVTVNVLSMPS